MLSWRTKIGGSWERVGAFLGDIHGVGKHMSGEYCETTRVSEIIYSFVHGKRLRNW